MDALKKLHLNELDGVRQELGAKIKKLNELNDKLNLDTVRTQKEILEYNQLILDNETKMSELEKQKRDIKDHASILEKLLNDAEKSLSKERSLVAELESKKKALEDELSQKNKDFEKLVGQNEAAQNEIQYLQNQFDKMCHELEKKRVEKEELAQLIKDMTEEKSQQETKSALLLKSSKKEKLIRAGGDLIGEELLGEYANDVEMAEEPVTTKASKAKTTSATSLRKSSRSNSRLNTLATTEAANKASASSITNGSATLPKASRSSRKKSVSCRDLLSHF